VISGDIIALMEFFIFKVDHLKKTVIARSEVSLLLPQTHHPSQGRSFCTFSRKSSISRGSVHKNSYGLGALSDINIMSIMSRELQYFSMIKFLRFSVGGIQEKIFDRIFTFARIGLKGGMP
jgi:hypothetical protein